MNDVQISAPPLVAWLAALALSRHGLGGCVATGGVEPERVALDTTAMATLRRFDLGDDLLREGLGNHGGSLPTAVLLDHVRRRTEGFGLFRPGTSADAFLSVGTCAGADVAIQPAPGSLATLDRIAWRIAGVRRGWLRAEVLSAASAQPRAPLSPVVAGTLDLGRVFDVGLVLLACAEHTGHWRPAVEALAPAIPLDLVTLGAGGRLEADPADREALLGVAGACLVAPGGERIGYWPEVPPAPLAAVRAALVDAGVVPGVLR